MFHFMQLTEIMPSLRLLTAADKLHLIRILATDIDDEDFVAPLEHGRSYRLASPRFEEGATQALLTELTAQQAL